MAYLGLNLKYAKINNEIVKVIFGKINKIKKLLTGDTKLLNIFM